MPRSDLPSARTTAHSYSLVLDEPSTIRVPVTPPTTPQPPPHPEDSDGDHSVASGPGGPGYWELVTPESQSIPVDAPKVLVHLNGETVTMAEDTPISLEVLGMERDSFLYVDGKFVRTKRDGRPVEKIGAENGMEIKTQSYPTLEPFATIYRLIARMTPPPGGVAGWIKSPWGRTTVNAVTALIEAAMVRPSLKGGSNVEIIISVVAGAHMFDLLIRDTLLNHLRAATLTSTIFLFTLLVFQLCFMIGASIPFACLRLLEWHVLPTLFLTSIVLAPGVHWLWVVAGKVYRDPASGWRRKTACMVLCYVPVLLAVGGIVADVMYRRTTGYESCEPRAGGGFETAEKKSESVSAVMGRWGL
ncbi:hypothetical protein HK104_003592 [Borealophlyctis nickersoniae]|nr:hypothetical protein HK104_003592 [Borealophlyctis nickersoniae]